MITVIGRDGGPVGEQAAKALSEATLVVGSARHLDGLAVPAAARVVGMTDVPSALELLAAHQDAAVVLASGDPGFFGIVRALRAAGLDVVVEPARSSVALAFARIGLSWDDAVVVSAHGASRPLRRAVNVCRARRKVAVLTGPGAGPAELAAALRGLPRTLVVAADLGAPEETVTWCSPEEATARTWPDLTVVLSLAPALAVGTKSWVAGDPGAPPGWALPETAFRHRDSMITKAEVRAMVLARLGPRLGDLVWDVGAGSGSVAVECARLGAAVIAVERDADACASVAVNADRHDVDVQVAQGTAPDALAELPDPDAVFVGGGGPDVLSACLDRRPSRIVIALAALDRAVPALAALRDLGYQADATMLSAARLADLPGGGTRLAATNPVFVVSGARESAVDDPPLR